MSNTNERKQYNGYRFEVLEGNGTLYVVDNEKQTIKIFRHEETRDFKAEGRTTQDYVENALLTNGWRHLRNLEDGANTEHDE